jgi:hypothetical protein
MDIVSYLLELIETRKVVGVNALGTLYKKKTPGRYDSETHSFLPPKYEIAFTSEVKEDQELVNFISEKKSISTESANYYISEFVENIQAQLADHQQADFSPLGKLKLINDEVVLELSDAIGIGFASYGLPSISNQQNQSLNNEQSEPTVEESPIDSEPDQQPVYDEITNVNAIQELNENEERVDLEQETDESNKIKPPITDISDPLWKPTVINRYEYDESDEETGKSRWIRILFKVIFTTLAIAAVIGVLIYFLYPDLFYKIKDKFPDTQIESSSGPSVMNDTGSTLKKDSIATRDTVKKNVVFTSIAKDTVATATASNTITYEVIGSAMKMQKKVDEVISLLAKRGINAKKVESMPGRLIKISLGTFTDYNLAKKFQDSLKIKLRNPEIYIQTIKPKN